MMFRAFALVTVLLVGCSWSLPAGDPPTGDNLGLVIVPDKPTEEIDQKQGGNGTVRPLQLKSMLVESNVTNRYAHTVISSKYANPGSEAQEATFSVVLPDTAFITGFLMEIKGKVYKAYVEEKKEAKRIYDQAVASGLGAAHVEVNARDSNRFTVSANIEPQSKVIFNLTYEELLVRRHNKYEMVINLHPGQLVKDLQVDVFVNETKRLLNVDTPALRSGNDILEEETGKKNEYAEIKFVGTDGKVAHIHFAPSVQQQKVLVKNLDKDKKVNGGIAGQFVVEYDVERDPTGGQVLVSDDGYFVHFFSPSQQKPIPKHVVFVLDVSGSMFGRKIEQVREAMQIILGQLSPADYFNLVEFSFGAKVWNLFNTSASPTYANRPNYWWKSENNITELPPAFPATIDNIKVAKTLISQMESGGGTNIFDALSTAINITNAGVPIKNPPGPIIVFLTDGDATDGEVNPTKITDMITSANEEGQNAAIFTLAFGSDANKSFLKKLSLRNSGFMRHIYEAADSSLQLQDFYKEISSPLLSNVSFEYPTGQVELLTKNYFKNLFDGSELIVAGKMARSDDEMYERGTKVQALTIDGPIDFPPEIIWLPPRPVAIGQLERLWAYMTIKQLLDKAELAEEKADVPEKKRALDLALKYSFVTPVTSLVVVKPNETKPIAPEEAIPGDRMFDSLGYNASPLIAQYQPISAFGAPGVPGHYASAQGFAGALHSKISTQMIPALALGYSPPAYENKMVYGSSLGSDSIIGIRISEDSAEDFGNAESYLTDSAPPSTTYRPAVPTTSTTTKISSTVGTRETSTQSSFAELLSYLPWLSDLLKPETEEVVVDGVSYRVGNNVTVVEEKPCRVTSSGEDGNCTLFASCPAVFSNLTGLEAYRPYMCTLESETYLGVCCVV